MNRQNHLYQAEKQRHPFTLVKTAIEAKELPKLIPTTGSSFETTMGASALPFGVVFVVIARDIELEDGWNGKKKKKVCTRHDLQSRVLSERSRCACQAMNH